MAKLNALRAQIDGLDRKLAEIIAERLGLCAQVAHVKLAEGISMMQPDRVTAVREAYAGRARELGVSPDLLVRVAVLLIDEACRLEAGIMGTSIGPRTSEHTRSGGAGGVADGTRV
ncbi:chorismate mutase [Microbispora amethystogenes]|uniref:Chorismate mutase domain-containing protein n=1 Tax=Microbispora amethystogenes TaxID=1427754 RepID=A0ABQ4FP69_9ACTN|nr:chorismate mutase [Microbispora amethystogenes]GIH36614.1 hypothetical protein Mam01_67780 [Microbispora amethystogenes]